MNKKISTPIALGIILVLAILLGGFALWQFNKIQKETTQLPEIKMPDKKIYETADSEIYGYLSVGCGQECGECCYAYTYKEKEGNKFINLERITVQASEEIINECILLKGYKDGEEIISQGVKIIKECIKEKETDSDKLDKIIISFFCDDFVVTEWGKLVKADFSIINKDLNNDGVNEIIATALKCHYEKNEYFLVGPAPNYPYVILQKKDESWVEIGNFNGTILSMEKGNNNGYYDIEVEVKLGFDQYEIELYQWNKSKSEYELVGFK